MTVAHRIRSPRVDGGARLVRLRMESLRLAGRLPGGALGLIPVRQAIPVLVETGQRGSLSVIRRWPAAARMARGQAVRTWRALVSMPVTASRSLALVLVGLTAGVHIGGAPRPVKLAAIGSTLVVGVATLFPRHDKVSRGT